MRSGVTPARASNLGRLPSSHRRRRRERIGRLGAAIQAAEPNERGAMPRAVQAVVQDVNAEEAKECFKEAVRFAEDADSLSYRAEAARFELGLRLALIFEKNWHRTVSGMSRAEFVAAHFKDRLGLPAKLDWAELLARQATAVQGHPMVEAILRQGTPGGLRITSLNSAFFACEIARHGSWMAQEIEARLGELKVLTDDGMADAQKSASLAVQRRIVEMATTKTVQWLREEASLLKKEADKSEGRESGQVAPRKFASLHAVLPREVHDHIQEVADKVAKMYGETFDGHMSPTQVLERVANFGADAMEAFEDAVQGETSKLHALLAVVAKSKGVRVADDAQPEAAEV